MLKVSPSLLSLFYFYGVLNFTISIFQHSPNTTL
ncbi:DUF3937 family protein [Acinetobacter seifertii]|nr:DUF3937 family protein [Acinetobacter seifertii]